MKILEGSAICQVALVVEDIEKTAKEYAKIFGVAVPDIFTVPDESVAHTKFKGRATKTEAKLAVFDLGQVVLELTQPDKHESSWKDFLDKKGPGVHHIAFMTDDREAVVDYFEKNEMPIRHYGEYEGGNYTVFDSAEKTGVYIQVKYEPGRS